MFKKLKKSLVVAGTSAGLMYLLDPDLGRRRRARLRDRLFHAVNQVRSAADITLRDMQNRLCGTYCEWRALATGRDNADDVVADRVRSKLGRYVSHPSAIEVKVQEGRVVLRGLVRSSEVRGLLAALEMIDGVEQIDNRLEVHASAENVSTLQGGSPPAGEPLEFLQANWSPTARFVAGTAGGVLILNCLAKRTFGAMLCGAAGTLLLARALSGSQASARRQPTRPREDNRSRAGRRQTDRPVPAGASTPQVEPHIATTPGAMNPPLPTDDIIDEASMESFPASDAPSFMGR